MVRHKVMRKWCLMVILFAFLMLIQDSTADCTVNTTGVQTFGPECQYMCHCKNSESCDEGTGECTDGCDTNWFGPACQYRDLAEGKFARHNSNIYPPKYSVKANDGNPSTCSSTKKASQNTAKPYWRVWFSQNETIRDVNIHTRNDRLEYFPGFEVTVEYVPKHERGDNDYIPTYKHTCYQHDDTVPGSTHIHVQCEQALVGNQVRITLSSVGSQLVLCDVRIGAGRNFAFRKYVNVSQYNNNYPPINAVDGIFGSKGSTDWTGCFVASTAKYQYLDIDLGMPIHAYSVNINTNSDDNIKDYQIYTKTQTQTGHQLLYNDTGNMPPVTNVQLNTDIQTLRVLTQNTNQMVICELEIYGECPTNRCGYDCSENCYCKSYEDMEQWISGVCTTGCQGRWTGTADKCNIECEERKWGTQCQNDCGACRSGTCDAVSGKCAECESGMYGSNCVKKCGFCRESMICDKVTGICPSGCIDGFVGDTCDQVESTHLGYIITIAGSVVAGIIVICITVIIIVCAIMRRNQQVRNTNPDNNDEHTHDPTSLPFDEFQHNCVHNDTEDMYESIV